MWDFQSRYRRRQRTMILPLIQDAKEGFDNSSLISSQALSESSIFTDLPNRLLNSPQSWSQWVREVRVSFANIELVIMVYEQSWRISQNHNYRNWQKSQKQNKNILPRNQSYHACGRHASCKGSWTSALYVISVSFSTGGERQEAQLKTIVYI